MRPDLDPQLLVHRLAAPRIHPILLDTRCPTPRELERLVMLALS